LAEQFVPLVAQPRDQEFNLVLGDRRAVLVFADRLEDHGWRQRSVGLPSGNLALRKTPMAVSNSLRSSASSLRMARSSSSDAVLPLASGGGTVFVPIVDPHR